MTRIKALVLSMTIFLFGIGLGHAKPILTITAANAALSKDSATDVTFTVTNNSGTTLTITEVALSSASSLFDKSIDTDNCGGAIVTNGNSCTVIVTLTGKGLTGSGQLELIASLFDGSLRVGMASPITVTVNTTPAIGDNRDGGVVACLEDPNNPGTTENFQLIAATADNSDNIEWGGEGTAVGAEAQSEANGAANTETIVAELGVSSDYAARLCSNYSIDSNGNSPCADPLPQDATCYNDWFLPAKDQLNCLFTNQGLLGGFASVFYWSSTEFSGDPADLAWLQFLLNGSQVDDDKDFDLRVRCVRAFTP